jgi:UPF0716 protein FxsA
MRLPSIGRVTILGWAAAEFVAYVAFFSFFPFWAGFLVGLGSTILGIVSLRLLGARIAEAFKARLTETESGGTSQRAPLALLGAFLLLIPGFLSDFAGLALLIFGAGALFRQARAADTREIKLEQHEWKRLPDDPAGR